MYEDEYGIPLKLNHELKTMKEAEDYFKRLEKYVGDYKLNYYISEIDEKENRFNYTQNNDAEKIIRLIGIGDKRKKDNFKLGVITLDLSMFKDKDEKEIYRLALSLNLFTKIFLFYIYVKRFFIITYLYNGTILNQKCFSIDCNRIISF